MDLKLSKIFRAGLASICFSTSPVKWNPASPSCSLSLRTSRSLERWVKSSSSISGGLKVLSPQASKTTIETLNSDIAKLGGQITKVSSQVNAPNTEKEVGLVYIVWCIPDILCSMISPSGKRTTGGVPPGEFLYFII